jgi:hypothetical protein
MDTPIHTLKGWEKILCALAVFGYLPAEQLTRLLYAPSSASFVRKLLRALVAAGLVLMLPGRVITLPHVYTPTTTGYTYVAQLGVQQARWVRPVDEREKAQNLLFLQHTLAVNDVLIAARLLSQTHPTLCLPACIRNGSSGEKSMWHSLRKSVSSLMPVASFQSPKRGTRNPRHGMTFFTLRFTAMCPKSPASSKKS